MPDLTLVNCILSDGTSANITMSDGLITEVGSQKLGVEFDATGLIALPGLIDLHAHFREPGGEHSESIETGSRAALSGGFTSVFVMPNTNPTTDTTQLAERIRARGANIGLVDVFAIGAVTSSLGGEELSQALLADGNDIQLFSDDGYCVANATLMREALRISAARGCVISQHSQDPTLAGEGQVNAGTAAVRLGLTEWPNVAESSIVARDVELAAETGGRLHIAHVSTAESVEIIRWAKQRGINVTAEVTPHHLLLDDSLTFEFETRYKVNPPLRGLEDREALVAGLVDGTIDAVATDHAPHARDAKEAEWQSAAFGMIGLQQALGVVQHVLNQSSKLDWALVERTMSHNPAKISGLADRGAIEIGRRADILLIDPSRLGLVGLEQNQSQSTNNPYLGMTLPRPVVHVFRSGRQLVSEGVISD
jgi:dihydroorotase